LHSTIFLELIGLEASKLDGLLEMARSFVLDLQDAAGDVRPGLSPHAPYTASPQLIERVCRLSSGERFPVAMHLAESREELELLANHSGPLVEVLKDLEAWHPEAISLGSKPLNYLQRLAKANRALVIHGNYLNRDEMQFLATHADHMSVVYCPRTHSFFGHEPYPLADMLAAGVRVAVGTDSRASNPDLRILKELRQVAQMHPQVPPEAVLKLGTLDAAEALGIDRDYGSITAGKRASFAVVPLADTSLSPFDSILSSTASSSPLNG
jgi:cytosine/adenosine deaminase-related metal-dependent hydrolase